MSFLPALVVAMTALSGSAARSAETYLRWKFTKGEQLRESINTEGSTRVELAGAPQATKQTLRMTILRTVTDVDAQGIAGIAQKIERVELKVTGPGGQEFAYDSEKSLELKGPLAKAVGPVFKALVGAEITQRMTPAGEVKDIRLPQGLLAALKETPGAGSMGDSFSAAGLKRLSAQFPAFGVELVAKGKTFDDVKQVQLPFGALRVLTQFTYVGPEQRQGTELHKLDIQVSLSLQAANAGAGTDVKLKPGTSSGTLFFDVAAGRATAMDVQHSSAMVITADGKTIESFTESATKWTLESVTAPKQEASP